MEPKLSLIFNFFHLKHIYVLRLEPLLEKECGKVLEKIVTSNRLSTTGRPVGTFSPSATGAATTPTTTNGDISLSLVGNESALRVGDLDEEDEGSGTVVLDEDAPPILSLTDTIPAAHDEYDEREAAEARYYYSSVSNVSSITTTPPPASSTSQQQQPRSITPTPPGIKSPSKKKNSSTPSPEKATTSASATPNRNSQERMLSRRARLVSRLKEVKQMEKNDDKAVANKNEEDGVLGKLMGWMDVDRLVKQIEN